MFVRHMSALAGIAILACALAAPLRAEERPGTTPPTLYTRLGSYDGLARFVDTAFPRVAGHPQLRRLFQGHARDSQVRQRQLIIDALCQASGGPCAYTGRAMKPVHTGLGITGADWTVFTGILTGALDDLKVTPPVRNEFLALLDRQFKPDVVEQP